MESVNETIKVTGSEEQGEATLLDQDTQDLSGSEGQEATGSAETAEPVTEKSEGINAGTLSRLESFSSKVKVKAGLIAEVNPRMGTVALAETGVLVVGTDWIKKNLPCEGQVLILHPAGTMTVMTMASFKEAFEEETSE